MNKKKAATLFFFLSFNIIASAQTPGCLSVHEGTFRLTDKGSGTTIITRTKDLQVEDNAEMGVKMTFDLVWIDDCSYELRPKEVIKGDPALMGNKGDVLKVRIQQVNKRSYRVVTTANFADFELEREIEIL